MLRNILVKREEPKQEKLPIIYASFTSTGDGNVEIVKNGNKMEINIIDSVRYVVAVRTFNKEHLSDLIELLKEFHNGME